MSHSIPPDIRCAQDYEALAPRHLAAPTFAYVAGGSGHDLTVAANRAAFGQWHIVPRLLRDVGAGHTRITLAGENYAHPLFLAPVAFHKLVHGAGEIDTARAAHAVDACLITSTLASCTLEDVARAAGPQRWFQLYFQPQREATLDLLRRAEAAGYGAIVLTLDAPIQVASRGALALDFQLPPECVAASLAPYPAAPPAQLADGESRIFQGVMRSAPAWDDLAWLLAQARVPVWVKGVLHPDDATALRSAGVAGIVVSNHGGRSLDGAPASLDALPAIRAALGPDFPLLFDGGIRSGADIFKALALGAGAVAVGRLQLYALSVAGALGVAHMMKLLLEELEVCMALAGCATVDQITASALQAKRTPC
jgi:isopentenyl diphosphate isomerase/L-lactate dehydrogenase-like FMN-dependent dehydrogenase